MERLFQAIKEATNIKKTSEYKIRIEHRDLELNPIEIELEMRILRYEVTLNISINKRPFHTGLTMEDNSIGRRLFMRASDKALELAAKKLNKELQDNVKYWSSLYQLPNKGKELT